MARFYKIIFALALIGTLFTVAGESLAETPAATNTAVGRYESAYGGLAGRVIPQCLLKDKLSADCLSVDVFVALLINFGRGMFAILGAFALAYFVYGGFILIVSEGNQEKVKKGTGAMLAAATGLVVAFGGYLLIRFLSEAVGVKTEFKLK